MPFSNTVVPAEVQELTMETIEDIIEEGVPDVFENVNTGHRVAVHEVLWLKRHKNRFVTLRDSTDPKMPDGMSLRLDVFCDTYIIADDIYRLMYADEWYMRLQEQVFDRRAEMEEAQANAGVSFDEVEEEDDSGTDLDETDMFLVTVSGDDKALCIGDLETAHAVAQDLKDVFGDEKSILVTKALAVY